MEIKHMSRPLEIKELAGDGVFTGYASVFGAVDSHGEAVAQGAFTRTLGTWRSNGRMPAMLWMHDPTQPVGIWVALHEDGNGLAVQGKLALRTQKGSEAYELLRLGALTGLSIGYRVVASQIDTSRKVRRLTEIELFEISLVTFPANDAARIDQVKNPAGKQSKPSAQDDVQAAVARLHRAARILKESPRQGGRKNVRHK